MANMLALSVLGAGHTGFGPGSDGGRDGYFKGEAPYPSLTERWDGTWYLQAKFFQPKLSGNPQKWLLDQIRDEIKEFEKRGSRRVWPNNWIIVTNIEPSGAPETGCFDAALSLVRTANAALSERFAIWGGRKVLDLLAHNEKVARYYGEFITPGQVLAQLHARLVSEFAQISDLLRYLVVTQFDECQYTKLEQAGSDNDNRPGIHQLFVDLPYHGFNTQEAWAVADLARAAARDQRCILDLPNIKEWQAWERDPKRARVWFVKGGPGQGKSTLTQYFSQVQRAAFLISDNELRCHPKIRLTAEEVKDIALRHNLWPSVPRVPISIELKEYAHWYGSISEELPRGVLAYLANRFTSKLAVQLFAGTIKDALKTSKWLIMFDGLDEVPSDVKDLIADEICYFVNDVLIDLGADALVLCTSRPQGYSGQFGRLDPAQVTLTPLTPDQALQCACPVLKIGRTNEEVARSTEVLQEALTSPAIQEIMRSPLQAHIMAVVVRDGERPPQRKWNLFSHFYKTIKRRETNKNLAKKTLADLLRTGDKLLKAVHNRLGFELHAQAETSGGATTSLSRVQLRAILREVVEGLQEGRIEETVAILDEATTERLVLVSTPDTAQGVRFDVRQFQEFFAAEYISDPRENARLRDRLKVIGDDSHWREVLQFLLGGLIENERWMELDVAIKVIGDVDVGASYIQDELLANALALGAGLGGNLLQEGVLEADRNVRQQFRNLVQPLIGSIDSWPLLPRVRPPHSRDWLMNVLEAELKTKKPPHNIGASAALIINSAEGSGDTDYLIDEILAAGLDYQNCLIEMINPYLSQATDISPLAIRLMIRILCQKQWDNLNSKTIDLSIKVLRSADPKLRSEVLAKEFSSIIFPIIEKLFDSEDDRYAVRSRRSSISIIHGLLELRSIQIKSVIDVRTISSECWLRLSNTTGLLKAAYLILRFAYLRDQESMSAYTELESNIKNLRSLLPISLAAHLKSEFLVKPLESNPEKILNETGEIYQEAYYIYGEPSNKQGVDWASVAVELPHIALNILGFPDLHTLANGRHGLSGSREGKILYDSLRADPEILLSHVPAWSSLIAMKGQLGLKFRKLIQSICEQRVHKSWVPLLPEVFQLSLPSEANILPHLLAIVVAGALSRDIVRPMDEDASIVSLVSKIQTSLAKIVPEISALEKLYTDSRLSPSVRRAAFAAFHLRATGTTNFATFNGKLFLDLWDSGDADWFAPSIALALTPGIHSLDAGAVRAIGRLLNFSQRLYSVRQTLAPIVREWREFSRSPVKHRSIRQLWVPAQQ